MHIPTLYLDTSVIGGYFDDEWQDATRELWGQMEAGKYRFVTSVVTEQEISRAPQHVKALFERTFTDPEMVLDIGDDVKRLASAYIRHGILTEKYGDDALHVATCTVSRIAHLASWNFKHFVNPERKKCFNAINHLQGYPPVSIVTPQEFIYDRQDQEI